MAKKRKAKKASRSTADREVRTNRPLPPQANSKPLLAFGGGEENTAQFIRARYAMGDELEDIAAECGRDLREVYKLLRKCPDLYKETKQARRDFMAMRVSRQLNLCDRFNLEQLEEILKIQKKVGIITDKDVVATVSRTIKDLSARHAMYEGEATGHIKIEGILEDDEAIEAFEKEKEQVGHAIAVDDVGKGVPAK